MAAEIGDHFRLGAGSGSKPVIDRCGLDSPGPSRGGEQQERDAVGSAGNCNADGSVRRDQRIEVGLEAFEKCRFHLSP
jgi:hypothetical protein